MHQYKKLNYQEREQLRMDLVLFQRSLNSRVAELNRLQNAIDAASQILAENESKLLIEQNNAEAQKCELEAITDVSSVLHQRVSGKKSCSGGMITVGKSVEFKMKLHN